MTQIEQRRFGDARPCYEMFSFVRSHPEYVGGCFFSLLEWLGRGDTTSMAFCMVVVLGWNVIDGFFFCSVVVVARFERTVLSVVAMLLLGLISS